MITKKEDHKILTKDSNESCYSIKNKILIHPILFPINDKNENLKGQHLKKLDFFPNETIFNRSSSISKPKNNQFKSINVKTLSKNHNIRYLKSKEAIQDEESKYLSRIIMLFQKHNKKFSYQMKKNCSNKCDQAKNNFKVPLFLNYFQNNNNEENEIYREPKEFKINKFLKERNQRNCLISHFPKTTLLSNIPINKNSDNSFSQLNCYSDFSNRIHRKDINKNGALFPPIQLNTRNLKFINQRTLLNHTIIGEKSKSPQIPHQNSKFREISISKWESNIGEEFAD